MLTLSDHCAVDHHVFVGVIRGQTTKYPFDDTGSTPATQTSVHVEGSKNPLVLRSALCDSITPALIEGMDDEAVWFL